MLEAPKRRCPAASVAYPTSDFSGNPEMDAVQEWLSEDGNCWIAIASAFLQRNEREIALGKLANALQYLLRDGPPSLDTLGGRLFRAGTSRIDYQAVAVQIALAAEAADRSLRQF
jgi:hypothetical protein